jgi:hypothetical protein
LTRLDSTWLDSTLGLDWIRGGVCLCYVCER